MRKSGVAVPLILLILLAAGGLGGQAAVASRHSADLATHRDRLMARWQQDVAQGVPATALTPLRATLAGVTPPAWWSPEWWTADRQRTLDTLDARTDAVFADSLAAARMAVRPLVGETQAFLAAAGSSAPADVVRLQQTFEQQLRAAATPREVELLGVRQLSSLTQAWSSLATTRAAQAAARAQARADAEARARADARAAVDAHGGPRALLAAVGPVDQLAAGDNLDATDVDHLAAQLLAELDRGQPGTDTAAALSGAIDIFRQTVAANDRISAAMQPLLWEIDQAALEQTARQAEFQARIAALQKSFADARKAGEVAAVEQQQIALHAAVDSDLAAATCGHDVGSGKVLVLSLSLQQFVAYQDGCAVKSGPITTGRPQLPTPTGDFHVFYKTTPFTMISTWPKESPFYYPPSPVNWVMEFEYGGYFLHDAGWEADGAYGPGSQNNLASASHGCVHIQTETMRWLYDWTPVGTPVHVVA